MSVAVIQGVSGGIGLPLAQHILKNTSLRLYALTHRSSTGEIVEQLRNISKDAKDRISVIGNVDVREEGEIERAAKVIKDREGKGSIRLVSCLAGILHPEKSLGAISTDNVLDTFRINAIGHLLTYKHLVPLIPTKRDMDKYKFTTNNDPARGLVGNGTSLCVSLSARVGSIADNGRGGWYSYRASKAALNQIIRTLDHELVNKSSSAVAIAYHPGTVLTPFTAPVIGTPKPSLEKGVLTPEQAIEHLTELMGRIKRGDEDWGGRLWDWKGEKIEW